MTTQPPYRPDPWTVNALERGAGRVPMRLLLGECDDGLLYAPSRSDRDRWTRPFTWRRPTLWRFWLASRLTRRLVWLEA